MKMYKIFNMKGTYNGFIQCDKAVTQEYLEILDTQGYDIYIDGKHIATIRDVKLEEQK